MKKTAIVFILVIATLAALGSALKLPVVQQRLFAYAAEALHARMGYRFQAASFNLTLPSTATFKNIEVSDENGIVLNAESATATVSLFALMRQKITIPYWRIEHGAIATLPRTTLEGSLKIKGDSIKAKVYAPAANIACSITLNESDGHLTAALHGVQHFADGAFVEASAALSGSKHEWDQLISGESADNFSGPISLRGPNFHANGHLQVRRFNDLSLTSIKAAAGASKIQGSISLTPEGWNDNSTLTISALGAAGTINFSGPVAAPTFSGSIASPDGNLKFTGGADPSSINLNAQSDKIEIGALSLKKLKFSAKLNNFMDENAFGVVTLETRQFFWEGLSFNKTLFSLNKEAEEELWAFDAKADGDRDAFALSGSCHRDAASSRLTATLVSGYGQIEENRLNLESPLEIAFSPYQSLSLTPLSIKINEGTLDGKLFYDHSGITASIAGSDLPASLTRQMLALPVKEGLFDIAASLSGKEENLEGNFSTTFHSLILSQELPYEKESLAGKLTASLSRSSVSINAVINSESGHPFFQFEASLPIKTSFAPPFAAIVKDHHFTLNADATVPVGPLLDLFATDSSSIKGSVRGNIKGSGSFHQPDIVGELHFFDGSYENFQLGTIVRNIEANLTAQGQQLTLTSLKAGDSGNGSASATGSFLLDRNLGYPYDIEVTLNKFMLARLDALQAQSSGRVTLKGNRSGANLEGELTSDQTLLSLPDDDTDTLQNVSVTYVNLNEEEPLPTAMTLKKEKAYPIILDLKVNIPKTLAISNEELSSLWKGEVAVTGEIGNLKADGAVHLTEGRYILDGKAFELKEGTITFAGDLSTQATLFVVASREIQNYRIDILVKGSVDDPDIVLRSAPSLPQQEVLSLILFGRPPSEISPNQDLVLEKSLSSLKSKTKKGEGTISKLQKTIGIDTIDFSRGGPGDDNLRLQVGKYITPNLFISVDKSISEESSKVAAEMKIHNDFRLQIEADEQATGQISLKWRKDY